MPVVIPASVRKALAWGALLVALYVLIAGGVLAYGLHRTLVVGPLRDAFAPKASITDPLELGYGGDPRKAFGLPFETVAPKTDLGPAPAWWVPAARPAAQDLAAVYVHGIGGTRENGYRQLAALNAAGVPLLMITYRGDKGAPADPDGLHTLGLKEWRDLDAAITWLNARGYTRIIVAGESMGGAIVGQWLARSPQKGAATALMLDAPALDATAIVASVAERRHLPAPRLVAKVALTILGAATGAPFAGADSRDAVARFTGPLLLAHGSSDSAVPVGISDELESRRRVGTLYLRSNAEHLKTWAADPARYRAAIARLVERLG